MKKTAFLIWIGVMLLGTLQAQNNGFWQEAKGPYGGAISVHPTYANLVYADYQNEAWYRSADYGAHWGRMSIPELDSSDYGEEILVIGASGTFYKIVSYWDGSSSITRKLFRSVDEGAGWTIQNGNLPVLYFRETPAGFLLGFDYNGNLYRSANGGVSWQFAGNPGVQLSYYSTAWSFTPDGKILLWNQSSGDGLAFSPDNGLTWTTGEIPGVFTYIYLVSSGTLFGIDNFGNNQLLRSTDTGATWDTIPFNLALNESLQSVLDLNNGRLLMSTEFRIFYSDNDGITWQTLPESPEQPTGFALSHPLPNGDILGLRNQSLRRSSDNGASWTASSTGIHQAITRQLVLLTDTEQLAFTTTGLWRTANGGNNWTRLLPDTTMNVNYNPRPLAVLNADSFVCMIARQLNATQDGGLNFQPVTPVGGLTRGSVFAAAGKFLFCSDVNGGLRSADMGATWAPCLPGAAFEALVRQPSGHLFALATPSGDPNGAHTLLRSVDDGLTWLEINTLAIEPLYRRALQVYGNGALYVAGFYNHNITLAVSADEGATWDYRIIPDIYADHDFIGVNALGHLFTAGYLDYNIMTSVDAGASWYNLPAYTDHAILVADLPVSPTGVLYIVPSSGTLYRSAKTTESGAYITGQVRKDADADCSTPDAQEPLKNWVVQLNGPARYYASTQQGGRYTFFVDTGTYQVQAKSPQLLWWAVCDSLQTVQADDPYTIDTVDFSALPLAECPLMAVDLSIPLMRRCFENPVYVSFCNQGSETADSARVDVLLDPHLSLASTAQPYIPLGNNAFRFMVGNIAPGDCGQFTFLVYVDCNSTVIGQTHCIDAHAYPDTLCTVVPGWSGAEIRASVSCQDSTVYFQLRNASAIPSQVLNYIVIEDDIVLMGGQKQYNPGETFQQSLPANGHTWRIQSDQEPGHPFSSLALAFSEGCGGFGSLGFINHFPVDAFTFSRDQECVENTGSYDPNDKQGFPLGAGDKHLIERGQELEYLIRFQNTGTDTAFSVVVRDTLSTWFNPASVRPGAASHPYTWALNGAGELRFTFSNILLPDSNVNETASHGFVSFRVAQQPDVPLGSKIFNEAAIYFDYNAPVFTNRTEHTVGRIEVGFRPAPVTPLPSEIRVAPQPVAGFTLIQRSDGRPFIHERFYLTDALGRVVRHAVLNGGPYRFERGELPPGLYFFRVEKESGVVSGAGRLVLGQ